MEPVDEQLVAKVDQLRAEVDRSLVRVCGKRTDVPQRMLALATQQFTNVKGDGFDAVEGNPMEEEDVVRDPISVVGDALGMSSCVSVYSCAYLCTC